MGDGEGSSYQREKYCILQLDCMEERNRRKKLLLGEIQLYSEGREKMTYRTYQRDKYTIILREGEGSSYQREKCSTAGLQGRGKEKEDAIPVGEWEKYSCIPRKGEEDVEKLPQG
jgi:hypothetical protein